MCKKTGFAVLLALLIALLAPFSVGVQAKERKKYANFQEVALDMEACFQEAIKSVKAGEAKKSL